MNRVLNIVASIMVVVFGLGMVIHYLYTIYLAIQLWDIVGALLAIMLPGFFNMALFFVLWFNIGVLNLYTLSIVWLFIPMSIASGIFAFTSAPLENDSDMVVEQSVHPPNDTGREH